MKLSLLISSCNQQKRLRLSVQSALNQTLGPNATDYEIIICDDNSLDNTWDMLINEFGNQIKVCHNPNSIPNTYTLADNWNNGAKNATGERLIFSNGDIVFTSKFIEAHADPNMRDHIIAGPAMRTTDYVERYIDAQILDHYKIMKLVSENNWVTRDMRAGAVAHTYNKPIPYWDCYGYNFSMPKKYFEAVGGFDRKLEYGGEDARLAQKIMEQFKCKCLTNENAMCFHLSHPSTNIHFKKYRDEYFF